MRARHPDLFSDSVVESRPVLARPVFDHHLDTLTARKEEYQFEHLCRLIAERKSAQTCGSRPAWRRRQQVDSKLSGRERNLRTLVGREPAGGSGGRSHSVPEVEAQARGGRQRALD
jgi:hypothetical protein